MTKLRRGNYIFVSWIGDHGNHVHVYRDGKLITKWNLDYDCEESGSKRAPKEVKKLIHQLLSEGKFDYEDKKDRS